MVEYRKKYGSDTWHWCEKCAEYPTSGYDKSSTKPTSGELDNQCKSKEKSGTCH